MKEFDGIKELSEAISKRGYIADADLVITIYLAYHLNKPLLLEGNAGVGKAQPLYSKVKIPNGWTTIGDIKIGDNVNTPSGEIAKVIGIYPQDIKDIYRITFSDGRIADSTEDHLWKIYNGQLKNKEAVMTLKDIKSYMDNNPSMRKRIYVPLIKPVNNDKKDLSIEPYILGVLLGNGCFRNHISFSTASEQLIKIMNNIIDNEYKIVRDNNDHVNYRIIMKECNHNTTNELINKYLKNIIKLGLDHKKSNEKFIPDIYKESSIEQRFELIRGLMDTDGYSSGGRVSYCTVSKQLAEDVQYIIRSLGGLCKISIKIPSYLYKGKKKYGQLAYILNIRFNNPVELFNLDAKKNNVKNYQYKDKLRLRIKRIEKIAKSEAKCIMLDHYEHLYITDNFITTHNTEIANVLADIISQSDPIRLQCYEGIDDAKSIYEWNYKKQLLYIETTKDNQNWQEMQDDIYSENFLSPRPILKSISSDKETVLLIDEIDKSDEEFEPLLLEVLSAFQVSIPEIGTIKAKKKPFVILTSNNMRELTDALRRRCCYFYIDYPTLERELEIIHTRVDGVDSLLATQVAKFVQLLRTENLKKLPSISETIDWVRALVKLNAKTLGPKTVQHTLNLLLKTKSDLDSMEGKISSMLEKLPKKAININKQSIQDKKEERISSLLDNDENWEF